MSHIDASANDHAWIRKRLVSRCSGLLEENEEARFDRHIKECDDCAAVWREYVGDSAGTETEEDGDGHLPADMIASWASAREALGDLERELVASHLESCTECRQDLEFMGYSSDTIWADANLGTIVDMPTRSRSDWQTWLGWSWGAVASAAALALWLIPAGTPEESSLGNGVVPWVRPTTVRGGDTGSVRTLPSGASRVLLAVRVPTMLSLDQALTVRVLGPDGSVLLEAPATVAELQSRMLMLDLNPSAGLDSGLYRVEFLTAGAQPLPNGPVESSFELILESP